eukprot:TRINITY_DN88263_c0_g1_i1.p1 TRINITY_DN88263_c0_g1~~TRINITY_DN88263_c0_g1_i1.p1  ORF type:complete len:190 (-),score=28.66 TRINITY_DN88263_c0_g1_i1:13-582(-)
MPRTPLRRAVSRTPRRQRPEVGEAEVDSAGVPLRGESSVAATPPPPRSAARRCSLTGEAAAAAGCKPAAETIAPSLPLLRTLQADAARRPPVRPLAAPSRVVAGESSSSDDDESAGLNEERRSMQLAALGLTPHRLMALRDAMAAGLGVSAQPLEPALEASRARSEDEARLARPCAEGLAESVKRCRID